MQPGGRGEFRQGGLFWGKVFIMGGEHGVSGGVVIVVVVIAENEVCTHVDCRCVFLM